MQSGKGLICNDLTKSSNFGFNGTTKPLLAEVKLLLAKVRPLLAKVNCLHCKRLLQGEHLKAAKAQKYSPPGANPGNSRTKDVKYRQGCTAGREGKEPHWLSAAIFLAMCSITSFNACSGLKSTSFVSFSTMAVWPGCM